MSQTHITYLTGDATAPVGTGTKIIAHVCNDIGRWGKGFVLVISKRWPEPEHAFKAACAWQRIGIGTSTVCSSGTLHYYCQYGWAAQNCDPSLETIASEIIAGTFPY
jgi:O-acetyl-ADP-ribose deacetylase (regulator of RNase III)